jgi:alanine racemase
MVDVTDVAHIALGDEVVIYGADSGISVEELARRNQTIPYEIMCAVSSRVPRVYVSEGNVESVRDSFV